MNVIEDKGLQTQAEDDRWEQAADWFLRLRSEAARTEDLPELQRWIDADPRNALAYQQVSAAWGAVGTYASAPEIVIGRRDALEDSRKAGQHRFWPPLLRASSQWRAPRRKVALAALAACALAAIIAGAWWRASPHWTLYTTERGEQRSLLLADGSVVALDAHSRARVRYTESGREVTLEQGQARFTVAKDPLRPFRVRARGQTVVALGTQFDIDLVSHTVLVTLIEGHIAVAGISAESGSSEAESASASAPHGEEALQKGHTRQRSAVPAGDRVVELMAGEALRVRDDGRAVRVSNVDLTRATAWQAGRMFFDNEPLASAVERINRYTREEVEVDPSVATLGISGVFNAGDTDAFIDAVTAYFPVEIDRARGSGIYLTRRK